jgi:phage FluMu protein Com
MKYFKTTVRCSECNHKFLYALTEEEIEESDILEAMCPECGEMVELENLTPCTESTYESIIEVYEASLEEDLDFDLEDFEDELDNEDW